MATKVFKSGAWRYRIKHRLLPKPHYFTYESEKDGDEYAKRIEELLAKGIVPQSIAQQTQLSGRATIAELALLYAKSGSVKHSNRDLLETIVGQVGDVRLPLDYDWVLRWVATMKEERLAPGTIRKRVGCLARVIDSQGKKKDSVNPLRLLPKGYSSYPEDEVLDEERNRRISEDEEKRIRAVLAGGEVEGRQRKLKAEPLLTLMFDIALESAMRMREIYTLTPDQVRLDQRTIHLERTKNGSLRQVPITSVLMPLLVGFKGFPWVNWAKQKGPSKVWAAELKRCTSQLSRRFGTAFAMAGCDDLNFHDTRHEAICRIFIRTRLRETEIARITGHKDPRQLARYASLRGSELANELW